VCARLRRTRRTGENACTETGLATFGAAAVLAAESFARRRRDPATRTTGRTATADRTGHAPDLPATVRGRRRHSAAGGAGPPRRPGADLRRLRCAPARSVPAQRRGRRGDVRRGRDAGRPV